MCERSFKPAHDVTLCPSLARINVLGRRIGVTFVLVGVCSVGESESDGIRINWSCVGQLA